MNYNNKNCPWVIPLGPSRPLGRTSERCESKSFCKSKSSCGCNSAFRASSNTNQPIPAGTNTFPQVQYEVEELDLNNEYDPATSTFIPKQSGVYFLFASIEFTPTSVGIPITIVLEIRVNGNPRIRDREEFTSSRGAIDASGILPLQAGDVVQVFAAVAGGNGSTASGVGTRFEGARIS